MKTSCSFSVLLFFLFNPLVAQRPNLDSLELVLKNHSLNDSIVYQVLDQLIEGYTLVDRKKALRYAHQYRDLTKNESDSLKTLHAGCHVVLAMYHNELYDSSLLLNEYLYPLAERLGSRRHVKFLTSLQGMIHSLRGEYESALVYLTKALEMRKEDGDPEYISISLNNLSVVYYKMKAYEKALGFMNECIRLKEEHQDYFDYDIALTNAALCQVHLGNYDEAHRLFDKAISFYGEKMGPFAKAMIHYGRGIIEFNLEKYETAKGEFWKSYEISRIDNDYRTRADNLLFIGKINFLQGNIDEGFRNLLEVERVAEQFKYREMLISVLEELIKGYRQSGDVNRLLHYQDKYILLRNEMFNARLTEQMAVTEVRLKRSENQETLARQEQMLSLNNRVLKSQRRIIIATISLTVLIIFGIIIFFRMSKMEKRINRILSFRIKSKTKLLEQKFENDLRETERQKRLYNQLLDHVAARLATLKGLENITDKINDWGNEEIKSSVSFRLRN